MNRSISNLSVVLVLSSALLGGCGAQLVQSPYANGVTDGDRYAASLEDAFDRYEAEVADAEQLSYVTDLEAQAVAQTLAPRRFDVHLAASLQERGLTRRGLGVYAANHPEFADAQTRRFEGRLAGIEQRAFALLGNVDSSQAVVHPDLVAQR